MVAQSLPMNGHLGNALIMVIGILLGLVQMLFGLLLKTHKETDDERIAALNAEVLRLRDRVHELTAQVGKLDQWQRFRDEDEKERK